MSHTPGPWFASPLQTADDGWTFCTVGPFDVRGKSLEHHVEDTIADVSGINHDAEANARMIAAAPDLLEAARAFLQKWEVVLPHINSMFLMGHIHGANYSGPTVEAELEQMKAAIAKAEGRS
jgi:hypothetical protein